MPRSNYRTTLKVFRNPRFQLDLDSGLTRGGDVVEGGSFAGPPTRLCLDLIEKRLTGVVSGEEETGEPNRGRRIEEHGRAPMAHTMIGHKRLKNVRSLCEDVIRRGVKGDFIETGVWRGDDHDFGGAAAAPAHARETA